MSILTSKIRKLLLPFSWLYGIVVNIRNWMYDRKILKQYKYNIPVICVGNITVGGTGKTPHIEYLIKLLSDNYKVGVLSRGYKRKSKGFKVVNVESRPEDAGDEPLQIKQKYPHAFVYVDKDRKGAIERILSFDKDQRPDVILLDDGYQHRRVQPSLSVLLVDSNRPIHEDLFLPAGNLRDSFRSRHRASIVIVTKNRKDMSPIEFRICETNLDLFPFQKLYFSSFDYGMLHPVFPNSDFISTEAIDLKAQNVLMVTGIAVPGPLREYLSDKVLSIKELSFPDHHNFNKKDIELISDAFLGIELPKDKIIITTEKDATRLKALNYIDEDIKKKMYYIPIEVVFLKNKDKESFNKKIIKHVRNYQTNS